MKLTRLWPEAFRSALYSELYTRAYIDDPDSLDLDKWLRVGYTSIWLYRPEVKDERKT